MNDSDFRTAQQLLELLRAKLGGVTDYRLAKVLGMYPQGISTVLTAGGTLSDENAVKLALELGLDPAYVIICMHWQRAKDDTTRAVWEDAASKILKASCFFFAGFLAHYLPLLQSLS
jgi:plasmid maintenance system antidote protein VapI